MGIIDYIWLAVFIAILLYGIWAIWEYLTT
jgi:hypothetical protein